VGRDDGNRSPAILGREIALMKIAIPDWQGRVSPVFDVAEQALLVDLDTKDGHRCTKSLGSTVPQQRAQRLAELEVDVVVCGAISWPLEALLTTNGIQVISLICGDVEEVIQALRDGTLEDGRFAMPGCRRKKRPLRTRRRFRGGGPRRKDLS